MVHLLLGFRCISFVPTSASHVLSHSWRSLSSTSDFSAWCTTCYAACASTAPGCWWIGCVPAAWLYRCHTSWSGVVETPSPARCPGQNDSKVKEALRHRNPKKRLGALLKIAQTKRTCQTTQAPDLEDGAVDTSTPLVGKEGCGWPQPRYRRENTFELVIQCVGAVARACHTIVPMVMLALTLDAAIWFLAPQV